MLHYSLVMREPAKHPILACTLQKEAATWFLSCQSLKRMSGSLKDCIRGWAESGSVASQLMARQERIVGERSLVSITTTGASLTASTGEEIAGSCHGWRSSVARTIG